MNKTGSRQKNSLYLGQMGKCSKLNKRCWPPSHVLVIMYRDLTTKYLHTDLTLKFNDDIFTLLYQVLLYVKRSFIPDKCTCTSFCEYSVYQKLAVYLIKIFWSLSPVWWEWTIFSTCPAWTSSGDSSTHLGMHFIHTLLPHDVRIEQRLYSKRNVGYGMGPYDKSWL
jgi:hypothetical protein